MSLAIAAALLLVQTGCSSIRYSLAEDSDGAVAFTSTSGKAVGRRPIKAESRSYFLGLGFVNLKDVVPSLGTPLDAVSEKARKRGKKVSQVAIVEETSIIDWALQSALGVIGLGGWLYSGSRTSTVTAQAEE